MYIQEYPNPDIIVPYNHTGRIDNHNIEQKTIDMFIRYLMSSESTMAAAIAYDSLVHDNKPPLVASYSALSDLSSSYNITMCDLNASISSITANVVELRRELNRKDNELATIKDEMRKMKQLVVQLSDVTNVVEKNKEIEFLYNEIKRTQYQ